MLYHASPLAGIRVLEPRASEGGKSLVYFSRRRENVLVYLGNPVEKTCRETGFRHEGAYQKYASYGFTEDGRLRLEEYWPNATWDSYKGVSGYIYRAEEFPGVRALEHIRGACVSDRPVPVAGSEYVPDAYDAIMEAAEKGLIVHQRYEELPGAALRWLENAIREEYAAADAHPEYRHFLRKRFPSLL